MINKSINYLIYSSVFVSLISSILSIVCLFTLGNKISVDVTLLIFFGTLLIYNLDHLKDIGSDRFTNPERTKFIYKNELLLKTIVVISFAISTYLFFYIGIDMTSILIPVFVIGVFHWKLKNNQLFSIIYITLSWTVVVVIFPTLGVVDKNNNLLLTAIIMGLSFLANATVFMASENKFRHTTVLIAKVLVFIAVIVAILSPSQLKPFAFIPGLTFIALLFYKPVERYNLIYMDGSLLVGGILCVLYKQFSTFL